MLRRYIELILYKTYADLRAESERTYLGFLWWIFEPVMFMAVFYVFFGLLMAQRTENYVPFLLIGLTSWQWFKSCITHGGNTILNSYGLVQYVRLPKIIFPIILILTDSVKFLFILALLLLFLWIYGYSVTVHYLALPLVLLVQLLFISGATLVLAAVVPFFPDLRFVVENILLAVFFMSGIFMDSSIVPPKYLSYYHLNPMVNLIGDYRDILMHAAWPDWSGLLLIALLSCALITVGWAFIRRFEYTYPKISL